jgi:Transposase DNA-binding/Transposase Tn5 dimerisation domain
MQAWIAEETATAEFGDERLAHRYRLLLDQLGSQPSLSIPAACGGRADVEAAYRFFDNPRVDEEAILAPHVRATEERIASESVVLVAQDTTEIDLTRPEQVVGGPLSDPRRVGLLCHVQLAVTPSGIPLGLVGGRTWWRDAETFGESVATRKQKPIEEKESRRWVEGYRRCCAIARSAPKTVVVSVADSEADIYECFAEADAQGHAAKFIVRACHDRRLKSETDGPTKLFEQARSATMLGTLEVEVSARRACSGDDRKRRQSRSARTATVTVRSATVTLRPPYRPDRNLPAVTVNVVLAIEESPPADEIAVEWLLVTDLDVSTVAAAMRCLEYYTRRWDAEVYFRVLKCGCGVEKLQLETTERVVNALAVYRVVAWRVLSVLMLGRECPDVSCDAVLEEAEWKAVYQVTTGRKPPRRPPSLGVVVRLIAGLGGYLDRPRDPPPGPKAMWVGLQQTRTLARGWLAFGPGAKARCVE